MYVYGVFGKATHGNTKQKSATASFSNYLMLGEKHRSTTSGLKITLISTTKVTDFFFFVFCGKCKIKHLFLIKYHYTYNRELVKTTVLQKQGV